MKREDICLLIEKDGFSLKKVFGIAELQGSSLDITCQTRKNVLELCEKLRIHEKIGITRLYESDKTYPAFSWVPIPFLNLLIQQRLEADYGKVLKVLRKKDKNGLLPGIRIITMNASDLKKIQYRVIYLLKVMSFWQHAMDRLPLADTAGSQITNNWIVHNVCKTTQNRKRLLRDPKKLSRIL